MSVVALTADYHGTMMDNVERFHGKQLLNIGWDRHLLFAAPLCVLVSPELTFQELVQGILPALFGSHPNFTRICWDQVSWLRSGEKFVPQMTATLRDNQFGHKAVLRMQTAQAEDLGGGGS